MLIDQIILIRYDIGIADKLLHESDLAADIFHILAEIPFCILFSQSIPSQLFQLIGILRYTDHFQSGTFHIRPVLSVDLIDFAKASASYHSRDLPIRP